MEQFVFFPMPESIDELIEILRQQDWIASVYSSHEDALYNPGNYLFNRQAHGTRYQIIVDRNIFSFILSAYKKQDHTEKHRAALALVGFCGCADILFDPTIPIYERANYQQADVELALDELRLFYQIDDSPNLQSIIDFAVSKRGDFEIRPQVNSEEKIIGLRNWFKEYSRLKEWDPLYLFVLKITSLSLESGSSLAKFRGFVVWCHQEFRYSFVATMYALIFFSKSRMAKMMKYKPNEETDSKKKALVNMTWDLFVINYYFRNLIGKKSHEEVFFASDDKVVLSLVKTLLSVSESPDLEKMRPFLHQDDYALIDCYNEILKSGLEREFQGKYFKNVNQRNILIEAYEHQLL